MKYKYVVIEDQKGAFDNLQNALKLFKDYDFVGHAVNVKEGVQCILEQKPQLIFLDVELSGENGFDLVKELRTFFVQLPHIIMVTAYSEFGGDAVNIHATYFLNKPIDSSELRSALSVFEKQFAERRKKLKVKTSPDTHYIDFDQIVYFESDSNYTNIIKSDSSKLVVSKTLKDFEQSIPDQFLRIQNGCIINSDYLARYVPGNNEIILQVDDQEIGLPIGRTYKKKIVYFLNYYV